MLNFGINTFTETLNAMIYEAITAELPEEDYIDNSEEI